MSDRVLIRPGQLDAARGEYDRRRAAELKHERAQLRADRLEAAQRKLDRIDLELAGLYAIRARELAVDLGRVGFDVTGLRPLSLPTETERKARRHRGRADLDPLERARKEEAFSRRCLVRTFTTTIRVR